MPKGKEGSEKKTGPSEPYFWVKYTRAPGLVDQKILTVEDLAGIGVENHEEVCWDRSNGYIVDGREFPEGLKRYLKSDEDFAISEVENPTPVKVPGLVERGPFGQDLRQTGFMDPEASDAEEAARREETRIRTAQVNAANSDTGPTTTVGGSGSD